MSEGIDASKQSHEGQFAISTKRDDFPSAVRALKAQGYPRENFESMGKVFKREGFVSSPLEERARLSYSMSQEIANTINNIDGVITARVHLVMPEQNPLQPSRRVRARNKWMATRTSRVRAKSSSACSFIARQSGSSAAMTVSPNCCSALPRAASSRARKAGS